MGWVLISRGGQDQDMVVMHDECQGADTGGKVVQWPAVLWDSTQLVNSHLLLLIPMIMIQLTSQ